jgi:hypothetical protein
MAVLDGVQGGVGRKNHMLGSLKSVLRFSAVVGAWSILAGLVQIMAGRGGSATLVTIAGVLFVFPASVVIGGATLIAVRAAERAGPAPLVGEAVAAIVGSLLAFGVVFGGLWFVMSAYMWTAMVGVSGVAAARILPARSSKPRNLSPND